jgi:hypothetical protein
MLGVRAQKRGSIQRFVERKADRESGSHQRDAEKTTPQLLAKSVLRLRANTIAATSVSYLVRSHPLEKKCLIMINQLKLQLTS